MNIHLKNLGPLKDAEFEIGDITIICGENNTGKTYATYALFGFLSFWREAFRMSVSREKMELLFSDGVIRLSLVDYLKRADQIIKDGCKQFKEQLPLVFAADEKRFEEAEFQITIDSKQDINPISPFERNMGAAKTQLFSVKKEHNDPFVTITLLVEGEKMKLPKHIVEHAITGALQDIIFGHLFPNPFIASAERTGAAIFRKELNFARNRILEQINKEKDINPFDLLNRVYSDYALAVKSNVDFARQLEEISKKQSFIAREHKDILKDFAKIIGGEYRVTKNDELYYIPKKGNAKLTLDESSSAVRSLLDIGFYIRHVAEKGDILMIDEPELNLHPKNQRLVARLLARLSNLGVKIFLTTHSDYIVKELNTLIMLHRQEPHIRRIQEEEGYIADEVLDPAKVRVYVATEELKLLDGNTKRTKCQTLVAADISPDLGIEVKSFDDSIDEMNRIQDKLVWGGR
jgi:AAA15 family ATPase/GTPase